MQDVFMLSRRSYKISVACANWKKSKVKENNPQTTKQTINGYVRSQNSDRSDHTSGEALLA